MKRAKPVGQAATFYKSKLIGIAFTFLQSLDWFDIITSKSNQIFQFIFMYIRTRNVHSIKKKFKIENMRFLLVGITNGSTKHYHIAYVKENGEKIR